MRKILVFQHVAREILGTLNPILKEKAFRVRYVNFDRDPEIKPTISNYNGLIVLGGYMGVYEADKYTHIHTELKLIEEALKKEIPVLGICLGAQMIAHVLGSEVRRSKTKEVGWCDIRLTPAGKADSLMNGFSETQKVFQFHGDTFDIPKSAKHLAYSEACESQAFKFGDKVYGLQFHLEADEAMIKRCLDSHKEEVDLVQTEDDTKKFLIQSVNLSRHTFLNFIDLFNLKTRSLVLGSR